MRAVETQAEVVIAAPRADVFDAVAPIDLPAVFRGYGPLPAVARVTDQTGGWDAVGETRTVHLSDGGSIREELTEHARPDVFGYAVTEIHGPLRLVASGARASWTFTDVSPGAAGGGTHVVWRYAFVPRAAWLRPLLKVTLGPLWTRYQRAALVAIREYVEAAV